MDQQLKQRPNHYQTLGLKPGARSAEIERAFAQQVSAFTPRAFGSVTAVSMAYETLRDPARRRAYDQSIGIGPPPPLTRFAVPASGTMPFMGSRYTASRLAALEPKPPAPTVEPQVIEPEVVEPEPARQPLPTTFTFEPNVDSEATSIRPIVLGAVAMVAAAALFGAWMGMVSTEEAPAEAPVSEVKADLPPPGPAASVIEPAAPLMLADQNATVRPQAAPVRRAAPPLRAEIASVPEPVTSELAEAPPVAEVVPAATERMPLGDATIARTIRKIGYPCGSVASTALGEGAGVFVVTCSSGHSYRAAPVNGRYRFRRL